MQEPLSNSNRPNTPPVPSSGPSPQPFEPPVSQPAPGFYQPALLSEPPVQGGEKTKKPAKGRGMWFFLIVAAVALAVFLFLNRERPPFALDDQTGEAANLAAQVQELPIKRILPEPSQDLITYTNKVYGFQLQYPKHFTIQKNPLGPLFLSLEDLQARQDSNPSNPFFAHVIIQRRNSKTLEDAIKERFGVQDVSEFKVPLSERKGSVNEIRKVSIDEAQGYYVHEFDGFASYCNYLAREGTLFLIIRGMDPRCVEDPTFAQMALSLHFLQGAGSSLPQAQ